VTLEAPKSGSVPAAEDPAGNFAAWFRAQGMSVLRTPSTFWVEFGPRVYQAFPYHWLISPGEDELAGFLKKNRIVGLRYSAPIDSPSGFVSYHAVFEGPSYGLDNLGAWARKNVRRGLKHSRIEPISFDRLADEGWSLQVDTLERQSRVRDPKAVEAEWVRRCRAARDIPGFEAWGAFVADRLGASVMTYLMGDCVYMLYQQCHRDFLKDHVNNALGFAVSEEMMKRPEVRSILYGLHSLDAPASVDEFKFRMGYTAKPVRQRVVFHPWLRPAFNGITHAAIRKLARMSGNPTLAKVEGLIRFYRQGKRPAGEQESPAVLRERPDGAPGPSSGPSPD
jgi:hypothetical protein